MNKILKSVQNQFFHPGSITVLVMVMFCILLYTQDMLKFSNCIVVFSIWLIGLIACVISELKENK